VAYQYAFVMKGLSKTYPGANKPCFKDITLSFLPGAKIAIIGPNGAGKSTLMKVIAGIDTEYVGEAWAAEGVRVALVVDSVGSIGSDPAFFEALAAGGVAVCAFNPINPLQRLGEWGLSHRTHRKLLVVDNDIAFTGGINISRVYASGSFLGGRPRAPAKPLEDGWRDTQIELRGPVVPALARTFIATWADQSCGDAPVGPEPEATGVPASALVEAQRPDAAGNRLVKVITSDPRDPQNRIYTTLLASIEASQRSVHLTMAYFAPGEEMISALCDAARRGVDVSLVLPGQSDFSLLLHAGRSYYTQLLDAGVRIHEYRHATMHAKTMVVDGVFATVGSSNMDWRSFVANNEINVVVIGRDFGRELEALFQRDVAASQPVLPEAWAQRPWRQRLLERFGRSVERLL
jgi:cardiolipin synthase